MNELANKLQAALEQSWYVKEQAVMDQDFEQAALIRQWGDKLKSLIREAKNWKPPTKV